ncbi:MAG: hypothetical protein LBB74_08005 [Chitinispirillales bacterium]|jgi:hypothetical protein|nr:hypothetical protein [Chitinispirillales bacterium]
MVKFTKLLLPVVAITAGLLPSSCVVTVADEGSAMVRFTWEAYQRNYSITDIIAGYEDVKHWHDYEYMAAGYADDDFTDVPLYNGSYDIRDKIYSSRLPQYATKYKGVYQSISAGKYTAVCTVEDFRYNNTFYIVANYTITGGASGAVNYYEVAFDARAIIDGTDDLGWIWGNYGEYPRTDEKLLEKAPAKRLAKKIERDGVVFHVFRRP